MIAVAAFHVPYVYRHSLPETWFRVHHYLLVTQIVTSDWKVAPCSACNETAELVDKTGLACVRLPTQGVTQLQTCLHKHNRRVIVMMCTDA
jgi:hypothetical protein